MKACSMLASIGLIQMLVVTHAVAQNDSSTGNAGANPPYYQPKSTDGEPRSRPPGCGNDGKRLDSFHRDLGRGVSIYVTPNYDGARQLSVNVIFVYYESGGLKFKPEKFQLHSPSPKRFFHPERMYRSAPPTDPDDTQIEEVYLEFSVPPKEAQQIEVVFPEWTVQTTGEALTVKPIHFARVDPSGRGTKSRLTPCMYSVDPPARIDASKLRAVPPVPALKALNSKRLNGYWVIDAKPSAEEFNKLSLRSTNEVISLAGWMFLFAYEFKDEVLTFGTVAGDKSARFQLLATPREDTQFTYKPEVQKGTDDGLLVVSATSSDHIRIAVSNHDFTKYFLYKRVKLDPNAREQNANTAKAALKEFADILNRQQ